ncbi:hypothetical protein CI102_13311 [Trichoderma harzianum]|nr:hypothetical protein CI102_13311 [Trichoderma harzianum]
MAPAVSHLAFPDLWVLGAFLRAIEVPTPNPETALGYPPDRQGNEMRRTCSSRSLMGRDRISSNSSKVSETGHGGVDARTPLAESAAVTAVLQISHDGLGEGPTGNAMQGPLTANRRPSVLRQGMGVGCKGESLDVMQEPGWVGEDKNTGQPGNARIPENEDSSLSGPESVRW